MKIKSNAREGLPVWLLTGLRLVSRWWVEKSPERPAASLCAGALSDQPVPTDSVPGTAPADMKTRPSRRRWRRAAAPAATLADGAGGSQRPFIVDDGQTRQLHFTLGMIQSAMRLDDPFALEFAYTRKMMAFLLFCPEPRDILMVGLGGGSLAKFCFRHLPRAQVRVVEVNPEVIALRDAFRVPDDPRLEIILADAADYLPLAAGDTDALLLDGFDATGVAPSLLTHAFYVAARERLRPGGLLVANFSGARGRWEAHFALLSEVFAGQVHLVRVAVDGNYVAFAFRDVGLPIDWTALAPRATVLARRVPLDFPVLLRRLRAGEVQLSLTHPGLRRVPPQGR